MNICPYCFCGKVELEPAKLNTKWSDCPVCKGTGRKARRCYEKDCKGCVAYNSGDLLCREISD
jgi:hypothetical protein